MEARWEVHRQRSDASSAEGTSGLQIVAPAGPSGERSGAEPAVGVEAAVAKKRKRGGDNNLDGLRGELKNAKTLQAQVTAIQAINDVVNTTTTADLTETARNMIHSQVKPVLRCLREHCNGSMETFAATWGVKISPSTFKKACQTKCAQ